MTNTNRFELQGNEQLNNNMAGLCGANSAAFCRTVCTSVRRYGGANQRGIEVKTGPPYVRSSSGGGLPHLYAPPYAGTVVQRARHFFALFVYLKLFFNPKNY